MIKKCIKHQNSGLASETSSDGFSKRMGFVKQEIAENYLKDNKPWVIAYSGGKDSTATMQLILEAVEKLKKREVVIMYADTGVEPPPVIEQVEYVLDKVNKWATFNDFPIRTKMLKPKLEESFFVLLLSKGYLPPTRYFRWCTERLKVRPFKREIKSLIDTHGDITVVLGLRKKESSQRDKRLEKRQYSKWMPFEGLPKFQIYAPILELSIGDIWMYLLESNPPWGVNNSKLRTLYTGGNSSCSLFCGGIRFGCWVCTVVKKDRCTEGLSQLPEWEWLSMLTGYRDELIEVRNNPANRILKRVNGKSYLGPLNLKIRKKLYEKLKALEVELGYRILSAEEEKIILRYLQT